MRKRKRFFGAIISIVILVAMTSLRTEAATLNDLRGKYPNGSTWNGSYNNLAWQCHGFALTLGYELTGKDPKTQWSTMYNMNSLKAGDIIRYQSATNPNVNGHSILCTNITGNTITYVDCNGLGGANKVKWDQTIQKNTSMFGYPFAYVLSSPTSISSGNNPQGSLDHASGGKGVVNVSGWALDKDNYNTQLEIHVYVGGKAGSGAPCYKLTANTKRDDVPNVFPGCGAYHGYEGTFAVDRYGEQKIYVYAVNIGGGSNALIGEKTVIIQNADTTAPVISNIFISDRSKDGYTVNCTVSDDVKVTSLYYPSWREGESTVWKHIAVNAKSKSVSVRINVSDHGNLEGTYHTHLYALDSVTNNIEKVPAANIGKTSTFIDRTPPRILETKIIMQNADSYVVQAKLSADYQNTVRVQFPTWTVKNGQDDIAPEWSTKNVTGVLEGDIATFTVKASDHNNECGTYITHVYAYDDCGNGTEEAYVGKIETVLEGIPKPKKTVVYNGHIYAMFDEQRSIAQMKEICAAYGGYLATITSQGENDAIASMVATGYWPECVLGGDDVAKEGNFTWGTEESFHYTNWQGSEPNNSGDEDYISMCRDGRWNDTEDGTHRKRGFILEVEADKWNPLNVAENGTSIYVIYDVATNWEIAKAFCEANGGHLATVSSEKENSLIRDNLREQYFYWLGANDAAEEGAFEWSTGEPFTYTNWRYSDPNNQGSNLEPENYLMMQGDNPYSADWKGQWCDGASYVSTRTLGFICEYDLTSISVTPPTKTVYEIGEQWNPSGMKVYAHFGNGTKEEVTGYQITGFDNSTAGTKIITVIYHGMTEQFTVSVNQRFNNSSADNSQSNNSVQRPGTVSGSNADSNANNITQVTLTKGDTLKVTNSAIVKITSMSNGKVTAEYKGITNKKATSVTVPKYVDINGQRIYITSIASKAFKGMKKLKKVVVGNDVKTIGNEAFSGCTALTKVTFGKNVTQIGKEAFYKCTKLKSITIPSKVTKIGSKAFYGCKNLKKITVKSTKLKSIGKNAIKGIHKKAVIKVPKKQYKKYQKLFKKKGQPKTVKVKK